MRKRNLLVFLLLTGVWPVTGLSAQDAWKITAGQIEPPSYYGITVANGMLGLVSSPEPLKISRVVLGGLYDIYGKGEGKQFLAWHQYARYGIADKRFYGDSFPDIRL